MNMNVNHLILLFFMLITGCKVTEQQNTISGAEGAQPSIVGVKAVPLIVLMDGNEFCKEIVLVESNFKNLAIEDLLLLLNKLRDSVERNDGEILYIDWLDFKRYEFIYLKGCAALRDNLNSYAAIFTEFDQNTKLSVMRSTDLNRIVFEAEYSKIKGIQEMFKYQSLYELDECVLQLKFNNKRPDYNVISEDSFDRALAIGRLKKYFGFPVLFLNVYDYPYILFYEKCDKKEAITKKALRIVSLIENDDSYIDVDIVGVQNQDIISEMFYISPPDN